MHNNKTISRCKICVSETVNGYFPLLLPKYIFNEHGSSTRQCKCMLAYLWGCPRENSSIWFRACEMHARNVAPVEGRIKRTARGWMRWGAHEKRVV
jgi:hypothetical protein